MANQVNSKNFQFSLLGLDLEQDIEEPDALSSSPGPHSSPIPFPRLRTVIGDSATPFCQIPDLSDNDEEDSDYQDYQTPTKRKSPQSNDEKTRLTLEFMRSTFSRFSLRQFLECLFTSEDGTIKNVSNVFLAANDHLDIMDLWWNNSPRPLSGFLETWVVQRAAQVCAKEASWLTDRAKEGKHTDDALFLRVSPKDVNVKMVNEFRISDLMGRYEEVTPNIQTILKSIIARDTKNILLGSRDPDHVCLMSFLMKS